MEGDIKTPPKWATRFLQWYCREDLLEEIEGDLIELYQARSTHPVRASLAYWWDVLRFFRWSNLKGIETQNNNAMIGNYFKTGWRNLLNQRATSVINISGLAVGIGCMITIFIFQDHFLNMDNFHSKRDHIYQVLNHVSGDGGQAVWSDISMPLYDKVKNNFSQVEAATRIEFIEANVRYEREVFREFAWAVDPDYFRMFDFPLLYGTRNVLDQKDQIVITRDIARKYFGDLDPMGKVLTFKFSDDVTYPFTVGAVMDRIPDRASFGAEILISTENLPEIRTDELDSWTYLTDAIFVELHSPDEAQSFSNQLNELVALQNESSDRWKTLEYEVAPLSELPHRGTEIQSSISGGAHPAGRMALTVIAFLLLLLACFNYVNIAVASGSKRLKEIALRKVMGSDRRQLIVQFLVENLVVCFAALLAGILLAYFIFLPGFNKMLPITIPFVFSDTFTAIGFFLCLILFVTVASGAYPAFFISRFMPVSIFRGRNGMGSMSVFSKILMSLQLLIAFTTIISCFVFNDNALQIANQDWGYNEEDVISVPVSNTQELDYLYANASALNNVRSVSASNGQIGDRNRLTQISHADLTINAFIYGVEPAYLETMGLTLLEGAWFDDRASEGSNDMVITRLTAKRLDLKDPVGTILTYDSIQYQVIGIVEDFHEDIFYVEILPAMFIRDARDHMNYITVRTAPGEAVEVHAKMADFWSEVAPNDPFEGFYQAEVMDIFFRENRSNVIILISISAIALFLACIGLYGIVSYQVNRRMKELSIRKVLGAGMAHISSVVNRDYLWMLLLAFLGGLPLGYWMIRNLIIAIYPDPAPPTVWPFVLAILLVALSVAITLGSQLLRVSRQNPVNSLRSE